MATPRHEHSHPEGVLEALGPKMPGWPKIPLTQEGPKMHQDGLNKTAPGWPKMALRWPKMAAKWPKIASRRPHCCFHLSLFRFLSFPFLPFPSLSFPFCSFSFLSLFLFFPFQPNGGAPQSYLPQEVFIRNIGKLCKAL